jgi:hypothetical protein
VTTGFEPVMKVLQTFALPLGYATMFNLPFYLLKSELLGDYQKNPKNKS